MDLNLEQIEKAIREFAKKLRAKKFELVDQNEDIFYAVEVEDINNIEKEMIDRIKERFQ